MAAKYESPEDAPRREEFSDFALVLKDGRELKCHKFRLAEVSSVFCAMLRQDCVETQTNKMEVTAFEPNTVESFLDYIYTDLQVRSEGFLPFQRGFDERRLTPELLRMADRYQVKHLHYQCTQHLKTHIQDDNVVSIWTVAEVINNAELKKVALEYLGKKRNQLLGVPGLKESFHSPLLMKSLVTYLADNQKIPTPAQRAPTFGNPYLFSQGGFSFGPIGGVKQEPRR